MHAKIEPTSRRQSNARTREHVASAHNKNNRQQQIADSNNKHNVNITVAPASTHSPGNTGCCQTPPQTRWS
jgi:phosphoribosylcarboxyaminoimidazole (NCAIR) mutase